MIETVTIHQLSVGNIPDLEITLTSPEISQGFAIVDMDGLGPVNATVNSGDWATIDGSHVNSIRLGRREITMELKFIQTDYSNSIEAIRLASYIYFPIKKKIRLIIHTDLGHGYYIDGYVSRNEPAIWSKSEGCNISIYCEDPNFYDLNYYEESFSQVKPIFHFPFVDDDLTTNFPISEKLNYESKIVYNESLSDIGAVFTFTATGHVVNPTIFNDTTYELFRLQYEMNDGDRIIIDTRPGKKSVILDVAKGISLIQYIAINSQWITLIPGENKIGIQCDEGFNKLNFSYRTVPLYQGI